MQKPVTISIVGTVGIPANYGGFETLVENLVLNHKIKNEQSKITVFCSTTAYKKHERRASFCSARLQYLPFNANGIQSIACDCVSILLATLRRDDVILLLGVSGALMLPLVRLFSTTRIVTNIDGIEWRREKWKRFSRIFLRWSESLAVKYSHTVIADNSSISDYVNQTYNLPCSVIAYGGDNAISVDSVPAELPGLPDSYSLSICRIEPENNIHVILEAFSTTPDQNLVLIGNWSNSEYGISLLRRFESRPNLFLIHPIYNKGKLRFVRERAKAYIHGHSAGGTNPSLVEAMHFGIPIFAFDCSFNRATTENRCLYFEDTSALITLIGQIDCLAARSAGKLMQEIAQRRYTWGTIADEYFKILKRPPLK